MTEHVIEWKARHNGLLKAFGIPESGVRVVNEQYEMEKDELRREIIDKVGWMKPRIIDDLLLRG